MQMEGHDDPTQDVPLLFFVWWGKHQAGLTREEKRRVEMLSPSYTLELEDAARGRY